MHVWDKWQAKIGPYEGPMHVHHLLMGLLAFDMCMMVKWSHKSAIILWDKSWTKLQDLEWENGRFSSEGKHKKQVRESLSKNFIFFP